MAGVEIAPRTFRERLSSGEVILREPLQTVGADTQNGNGHVPEPAMSVMRSPELHQRAVRLLRRFAASLRSPDADTDVEYGEELLDVMDDCELFLTDACASSERDAFDLINIVQAAAAQRLNRPDEWRSADLSRVREAADSLCRVSHFVGEDTMGLLDELAAARLYAFDPMT